MCYSLHFSDCSKDSRFVYFSDLASIQVMMEPDLTVKRKALITEAARALDKAKMLRFDEKSGNLYFTDLGRVASHFYVQYTSVETYNEMLKQHMNESEVSIHS